MVNRAISLILSLFIILGVIIFCAWQTCFAKTLVKYYKNTGEIIQTNNVDSMPSDVVLNDRFKSDSTDVILIDTPVNISTQRVNLDKKIIENIPQTTLDAKQNTLNAQIAQEKAIQAKIRQMAIDAINADKAKATQTTTTQPAQ